MCSSVPSFVRDGAVSDEGEIDTTGSAVMSRFRRQLVAGCVIAALSMAMAMAAMASRKTAEGRRPHRHLADRPLSKRRPDGRDRPGAVRHAGQRQRRSRRHAARGWWRLSAVAADIRAVAQAVDFPAAVAVSQVAGAAALGDITAAWAAGQAGAAAARAAAAANRRGRCSTTSRRIRTSLPSPATEHTLKVTRRRGEHGMRSGREGRHLRCERGRRAELRMGRASVGHRDGARQELHAHGSV